VSRCLSRGVLWAVLSLAAVLACAQVAAAQAVPTQAAPSCQWLTEGTAAAQLGGPVTVTATFLPSSEGSCAFALKDAPATVRLEVAVTATASAPCEHEGQKVPGIGNEAVACRIARSPQETAEVINSRVRAMYFRVSLIVRSASAQNGASLSLEEQQAVVRLVAEMVAGNLN
jgi:hypothetical protein